MKVGKLLLPNAEYHPGERAKIWINPDARPDETNPLNPYLLYEVPIRTSQFVGFIFTPDLIKGGRFDSTLIDSSRMLDQALLGTPDAKLDGTVVLDPAPLEFQKLIENAAKDWKAFTKRAWWMFGFINPKSSTNTLTAAKIQEASPDRTAFS